MLKDGKIQIGTGTGGPAWLLPAMANRHGLIAGATGTGKTVTLKVLAESFSDMGVPVFLSDIKSDLSGMVKPGTRTEALDRRLSKCGVDPETFDYHAYPSVFWDVYGKNGQPIQATVQGMGPQLLGRMLGLNETQTGVLSILFRYCVQYGYPLRTLEELKTQLIRMGENTQHFTLNYGNVSVASVGAIQRAVAMLEDEGGARFFGQAEFDVRTWLRRDENDRGVINILSADELFTHPLMYSTFLLWMLTRLYESLGEIGDPAQPVAVFFFDEAHLLFDDCSRVLMDKIEQVVRLIRSKGVGVYFITQSPADIPMTILGQLGNRVQHALRAYTPLDQKAVKVAAQTFRTNPDFNTEEAITALKTGEALVSCLDEDGAPGVVQRVTVLPPQSHMGALSEAERLRAVQGLPLEDPPAEEAPSAFAAASDESAAQAAETVQEAVASEMPSLPDGAGVAQALDQVFAGILGSAAPAQSPAPALDVQQAAPPEVPVPHVSETAPPKVPVLHVSEAAQPGIPEPHASEGAQLQIPTLEIPAPAQPAADFAQAIPSIPFPVSPTTPEPVQEITGKENMSPTFKVYDPTTGQYVAQENPEMTPVAETVPTIQVVPEAVQQAAQPVVQAVQQAAQPVVQAVQQAAQPVVQAVQQAAQPVVQAVQPVLQQMPILVQDPATGQYVQQMTWMQQDPVTGNWIPAQVQAAAAAPAAPVDPIALAEQQKAAEAARKEAEKAAQQAQRDAEKEAREAAKAAKEQEAAERRARNDALREEAAERARKNDSIAGRIKNTAIQTATRQVTSSLTKGLTNAISDLFGGGKKK